MLLELTDINKAFKQGRHSFPVLKNINLKIGEGEVVGLVGQSGSGKSTLLQVIGALMSFDSGKLSFIGKNYEKLSDNKKTDLRLKNIGFVYQYHHLLADFTALQNVMIPKLLNGVGKRVAANEAAILLEQVGLEDRLQYKPYQLSGGQQQRVAIARAMANSPKLILADEPTGNLDSLNSGNIMKIFLEMARQKGTTLVIATHNKEISKTATCIITIKDGEVLN